MRTVSPEDRAEYAVMVTEFAEAAADAWPAYDDSDRRFDSMGPRADAAHPGEGRYEADRSVTTHS